MSENNTTQAAELLQEFGLKEYESKSFVALTRMEFGTAKTISEVTDVPRTRVYDAMRVLEAKGLVEVQHTSPRRYRAVPVVEATARFGDEYASRLSMLQESLTDLPPVTEDGDANDVGEVWALSDHEAIDRRMQRLIEDANDEIVLLVGEAESVDEAFMENLEVASKNGVTVIVGGTSQSIRESLDGHLDGIEFYVSDLDWLFQQASKAVITRILLVDESNIVVGSHPTESDTETGEQAVVGTGATNGLVTIISQLVRTGLLTGRGDDDE